MSCIVLITHISVDEHMHSKHERKQECFANVLIVLFLYCGKQNACILLLL